MPYVGAKLEDFFHQEPVDRVLVKMADRGGDKLKEWIVRNTPIGRGGSTDPFHSYDVPGRLRASWRREPLTRTRKGRLTGWKAVVSTSVPYAPHVEWGTGLWGPEHAKYEIKPKKPNGWLHWFDPKTGKDVFAKRVMHPGSPGAHMIAIATQMVEAEFDHIVEDLLAEWAREQEASVHA